MCTLVALFGISTLEKMLSAVETLINDLLNPLDLVAKIINAVMSTFSHATGDIVSAVISTIISGLTSAGSSVDPLNSGSFQALGNAYGHLMPIAALLGGSVLILGIIDAVVKGQPGQVAHRVLVAPVIAFVLTAGALAVAGMVVELTNWVANQIPGIVLANGFSAATFNNILTPNKLASGLGLPLSVTANSLNELMGNIAGALVAIIMLVLFIPVVLIVLLELAVRAVLVYLIVLVFPLMVCGVFWPRTRSWLASASEKFLAIVFSKVVLILAIALAALVATNLGNSILPALVSLAGFLIAAFAIPMTMSVIPMTLAAATHYGHSSSHLKTGSRYTANEMSQDGSPSVSPNAFSPSQPTGEEAAEAGVASAGAGAVPIAGAAIMASKEAFKKAAATGRQMATSPTSSSNDASLLMPHFEDKDSLRGSRSLAAHGFISPEAKMAALRGFASGGLAGLGGAVIGHSISSHRQPSTATPPQPLPLNHTLTNNSGTTAPVDPLQPVATPADASTTAAASTTDADGPQPSTQQIFASPPSPPEPPQPMAGSNPFGSQNPLLEPSLPKDPLPSPAASTSGFEMPPAPQAPAPQAPPPQAPVSNQPAPPDLSNLKVPRKPS